MDLVKVGFIVQADGLQDAENRVDRILQKVDQLNNKKVNVTAGSAPSASGGSGTPAGKPTGGNSSGLATSERMLKTQQLLSTLLPTMDKQTANLVARFQLASNSVAELNQFLTLLGQNHSIVKQQKDAEKLAADQKKLLNEAEQARQTKFAAEQDYYQKQMALERKSQDASKAAQQKLIDDAEAARQKKFAAEQVYYQKQMELASKDADAKIKAQKKIDDDAEKARQKRFSADQKYYQQTMEQASKATQAEKNRLASQQKLIDTTLATTKYQQQGLTPTNAGKVARMEVSGADVATVTQYKQALLDAQKAMQGLGNNAVDAGKKQGFFNTQIGGIVKSAVLSAIIYGTMTAMLNLGAAIVKTADEYTSIQNRMKLYISDANELANVNAKLAQFATANNVGLRETSTLFARLAPSMQKIGANTAAVTTVVDAFGKSMRIGGATATEAASATLQFSQAMASGKLNGDEFRAISEASPRFLKAIADGSGIAADKLKEMSSAGALTTEVISKALIKEYSKLSTENEKLGYTLEQGANAMKTAFTVMIGEFNEGAGVTQFFGTQMMHLAAGLLTASEGAKEFGANVKQWFSDNKGIIEGVGKAVEILAYLMAGKLVAGYVVSAVAAMQAAKANIALVASQTGVSKSAAAASIMTQRLGVAALQAGTAISTAGTMMKTAFAFMGGWVGLITTVVTATAAYFAFNKASAATVESFHKEGESITETITKYKELNKVKQQSTYNSEVSNLKEINAQYKEQKEQLVTNVLNLSRHNDMTTAQSQSMSALALSYKEGKITLQELVAQVQKAGFVSEESKAKATGLAASVSDLAEKAGISKDLIALMQKELTKTGEKAAFASTGVDSFTKGLEDQAKKLAETTKLAKQYGLEIATAAKIQAELSGRFTPQEESIKANRATLLNLKEKYTKKGDKTTLAVIDKGLESNQKAQNGILQQKSNFLAKAIPAARNLESKQDEQSAYTKALRKAEKDADKAVNKKQKDREKYQNQAKELSVYITLLEEAQNIDVARIASEKEYQNAFGANLDQAKALYELQRQAEQVGERAAFVKAITEEEEAQGRLVALMQAGLDITTARTLVDAKFTNNAKGREAAEKYITNQAYEQHYAMADQIDTQNMLNNLLSKGYTIEQATFRVQTARARTLSGDSTFLDDLDAEYDLQVKILKAKQATQAYLQDMDKLEKERVLYVNAQAAGYEKLAMNMAIASKIAQNPDLTPSQAKKLVEAEELITYEKTLGDLKAKTYLATLKESDAVKEIIGNLGIRDSEQVKAIDQQQKLLDVAKGLSDEAERQRKNPIGDFSSVDFSVFGDIGNPFETALAGLNEFTYKSIEATKLLTDMQNELTRAKEQTVTAEAKHQEELAKGSDLGAIRLTYLDLEAAKMKESDAITNAQVAQDHERLVAKQKLNSTIVSGLGFAKSFFKEESKGYKVISGFEKAYQASKIAFALWEKKDQLQTLALTLGGYIKEAAAFVTGASTKVAAQSAVNIAKGTEAVVTQGSGDPYTAFARMAAMAALVAGLGIAVGSVSGGGGSAPTPANDGTGTVFGDSTAQSESIKKSIDLLANNSDLMLPINNSMLRALQNIESALSGVANLIIRGDIGKSFANGLEFDGKLTGILGTANNLFVKFTNGLEKFLTGGLNSKLGIGGLGTSIITSIVGGLFGKTSQSITGSGLYANSQSLGSIMDGGLNLQQYADVETKKKSWFSSSTSSDTQFGSVDKEIKNQFGLIFSGVFDSILTASKALDRDSNQVKQTLVNSIINIGKIDTKGLSGEEIQKKLEAVISAQADTVAKNSVQGLDAFQKIGEGYYETLNRVASGVEQASYFTDRLGYTAVKYTDVLYKQGDVAAEIIRQSVLLTESTKGIVGGFYDMVNQFNGTAEELYGFIIGLRDLQDQLFMTGKDAKYLTTAMVLGAGGLDSLSSGLDSYFEMLSPAEQAAELTRRLTKEFALFGKELPSNIKAYRNLVSSIDVSTEAGQKLYGQVIALAPEFTDLQDSLASANNEVNALVKSLRDLADEARKARGETDQPKNLEQLRYQFNSDSVLAMQGDITASERLLTVGKDLMAVSKQYSVSESEYARDLALIQRAATVSADIQEVGLGYTPPTLNTVQTNPVTVATTNSTTDAKLEALREDMITAITAVAKYTQDTANRLERWDYGDRMTVRVEQETGDAPIPVKVTP